MRRGRRGDSGLPQWLRLWAAGFLTSFIVMVWIREWPPHPSLWALTAFIAVLVGMFLGRSGIAYVLQGAFMPVTLLGQRIWRVCLWFWDERRLFVRLAVFLSVIAGPCIVAVETCRRSWGIEMADDLMLSLVVVCSILYKWPDLVGSEREFLDYVLSSVLIAFGGLYLYWCRQGILELGAFPVCVPPIPRITIGGWPLW